MMSFNQLIIVLVSVGMVLWSMNSYIPIDATIKKILNAVAIIAMIIWLLGVFGAIGPLQGLRIEKLPA